MLEIWFDRAIDAIGISFEGERIGHSVELDDNRIVDYSTNPGHPVGVSLHKVSDGVLLTGLPNPDQVQGILEGLRIKVLV